MNRSRFISWMFPAFLVLSLVPNLAAMMGEDAAFAAGAVSLAACWLLVWLRLSSCGYRPEFSILFVLPFAPALLALAGVELWPQTDPACAIARLVLWIACGCIGMLCVMPDKEDREENSRMDGTAILLTTLIAAYVLIQSTDMISLLAKA